MRSRTALPTVVLSVALAMSACSGDDDEPTAEDTVSPSVTAAPTETPVSTDPETAPTSAPTEAEEPGAVVTITIDGDSITPAGDRIEVQRDEAVTLEITSDRAGELHVHSKPEQYVEFEAGTSSHELVISAPGVVDIEDHETGHVIVQLQVS